MTLFSMSLYLSNLRVNKLSPEFTAIANVIPDSSWTASSTLDADHGAAHGNLGKYASGADHFWAPSTDQAGEYLQIDMTHAITVKGIATMGGGARWLTKFTVKYSEDGETWTDLPGEIQGNTDGENQNFQALGEGFMARYLRIVTVAGGWSAGGAGLRCSPLISNAKAAQYMAQMQAHMSSTITRDPAKASTGLVSHQGY
uniref:F5/8 type C domain-containing protein n=1 Tax=Branchiostoma floridae TaxID=7739 RepID=C3XXK3_BRAFL|eukprot:XP_002611453.1 hypothetical protein BRAFLDRAFT_63914 [Branchiostoma floridae]